MAIDKNIAALLDESAYTVQVCYAHTGNGVPGSSFGKLYTYVSNLQPRLVPGDLAIVPQSGGQWPKIALRRRVFADGDDGLDFIDNALFASTDKSGVFTIVQVVSVDADVQLEPGSTTQMNWIAGKFDTTAYEAGCEQRQQIEQAVGDAYKLNVRKSFKQQVLGGLDTEAADKILKLLNTPTK